MQWVLGRDVRIPGSLIDPLEASRLETHEAILTPGSAIAKQVALRDAARKAYIEVDSDDRMRRALLASRGRQEVLSTSSGGSDQ